MSRLPEGVRIYAVGDIHGRCDLLDRLFDRIDAHKRTFPVESPLEIYLGDYIDRGPQSKRVISKMIERMSTSDVIALAGNHEEFLLQSLSDGEAFPDWMRYGGKETLLSYGVPVSPLRNRRAHEEARLAMREALPDTHRRFLENLPISYSCGDYFFVHAGLRPNVPLDAQRRSDLLWIRDAFLDWRGPLPAIVVHGHTPVPAPRVQPFKINIDTGAYLSGRLTCLVLEGAHVAFI